PPPRARSPRDRTRAPPAPPARNTLADTSARCRPAHWHRNARLGRIDPENTDPRARAAPRYGRRSKAATTRRAGRRRAEAHASHGAATRRDGHHAGIADVRP